MRMRDSISKHSRINSSTFLLLDSRPSWSLGSYSCTALLPLLLLLLLLLWPRLCPAFFWASRPSERVASRILVSDSSFRLTVPSRVSRPFCSCLSASTSSTLRISKYWLSPIAVSTSKCMATGSVFRASELRLPELRGVYMPFSRIVSLRPSTKTSGGGMKALAPNRGEIWYAMGKKLGDAVPLMPDW